jgi:hypothetical protein
LGGKEKDRHRPWLGYALEESLRRSLFSAKDIVAFANADVLVANLPHQVISELITRALASGTFSAAQVIETAPPALLAEHLEPELLWRCLKETAERGGLSKKGGTRTPPARQWLGAVLQRALDTDLVTPADVLRFMPPAEFVGDAPRSVIAELIKNGLTRGNFDPALVLQHLTPTVIADHIETSLVWSCLADAVSRHFEFGGAASKPDDRTPPPVPEKTAPPVLGARPKALSAGTSGRIETTFAPPRPSTTPVPTKPSTNERRPVDDHDVLGEEREEPTVPGRVRS